MWGKPGQDLARSVELCRVEIPLDNVAPATRIDRIVKATFDAVRDHQRRVLWGRIETLGEATVAYRRVLVVVPPSIPEAELRQLATHLETLNTNSVAGARPDLIVRQQTRAANEPERAVIYFGDAVGGPDGVDQVDTASPLGRLLVRLPSALAGANTVSEPLRAGTSGGISQGAAWYSGQYAIAFTLGANGSIAPAACGLDTIDETIYFLGSTEHGPRVGRLVRKTVRGASRLARLRARLRLSPDRLWLVQQNDPQALRARQKEIDVAISTAQAAVDGTFTRSFKRWVLKRRFQRLVKALESERQLIASMLLVGGPPDPKRSKAPIVTTYAVLPLLTAAEKAPIVQARTDTRWCDSDDAWWAVYADASATDPLFLFNLLPDRAETRFRVSQPKPSNTTATLAVLGIVLPDPDFEPNVEATWLDLDDFARPLWSPLLQRRYTIVLQRHKRVRRLLRQHNIGPQDIGRLRGTAFLVRNSFEPIDQGVGEDWVISGPQTNLKSAPPVGTPVPGFSGQCFMRVNETPFGTISVPLPKNDTPVTLNAKSGEFSLAWLNTAARVKGGGRVAGLGAWALAKADLTLQVGPDGEWLAIGKTVVKAGMPFYCGPLLLSLLDPN